MIGRSLRIPVSETYLTQVNQEDPRHQSSHQEMPQCLVSTPFQPHIGPMPSLLVHGDIHCTSMLYIVGLVNQVIYDICLIRPIPLHVSLYILLCCG